MPSSKNKAGKDKKKNGETSSQASEPQAEAKEPSLAVEATEATALEKVEQPQQ